MSTSATGDARHDDDAAQLASLGYSYDTEFKRDMGLWGNVALGFTYLSPVVGVYTTIGAALAIAGPPAFWTLLLAGVGQLLVALVFGEIVSNFPVAGGVYPWSRRLWGPKYAWLNGWIYAIAINVTIASVAYGAGPFLLPIFGIEPSGPSDVVIALVVLLFATLINFGGTKLLARVAFFGFVAEIVASVVIGAWLLIVSRKHDLSVIFQDFRPLELQNGQAFVFAFAAAAIMGIFLYYGFEACGDVAEEVKDPGRAIPRAMQMTVYIGGIASMFIALGLILAIPSYEAVISGDDSDPITQIFATEFGPIGYKIVLGIIVVSFISCTISLQAAASRLIYSMGRDRALPGARLLSRFNEKAHVPPYALLVSAVIPAVVIVGSLISADALLAIVSFASLGIYIGFQMVVLAALRARLIGWRPSGKFTLGRVGGFVVNILALAWGIFGIIVLVWPAGDESTPWYDRWLVLISGLVVVVAGLVYLFAGRPDQHSTAPAGDAHTRPHVFVGPAVTDEQAERFDLPQERDRHREHDR